MSPISRRDFLEAVGAAGFGTFLASVEPGLSVPRSLAGTKPSIGTQGSVF